MSGPYFYCNWCIKLVSFKDIKQHGCMIFLFRFIFRKKYYTTLYSFRKPWSFPLESSFVTGLLDKKSFSREEVKKKKAEWTRGRVKEKGEKTKQWGICLVCDQRSEGMDRMGWLKGLGTGGRSLQSFRHQLDSRQFFAGLRMFCSNHVIQKQIYEKKKQNNTMQR